MGSVRLFDTRIICDYYSCVQIERQDRIKYTEWDNRVRAIQRWIICAVIGFLTGLIAFIIDTCIINLAKWKFDTIQIYLDKCVQQDCLTTPLMVWLAIDLLFVGIGTLVNTWVGFGSLSLVFAILVVPSFACMILHGARVYVCMCLCWPVDSLPTL